LTVRTDLAITAAIDFYHSIGAAKKEAELRFLLQYWTRQARHTD